MRHSLTDYEVRKTEAINELKDFIIFKADELKEQGWSFELDDNAPESFKALKATTKNKHLLISTAGNDTSIYGARVNSLFRFWHDVTHLTLDKSFSLDGETIVINHHIKEAIGFQRTFGLSDLAIRILIADTLGQVKYYYKHKRFVSNQSAFIDSVLSRGLSTTLKVNI